MNDADSAEFTRPVAARFVVSLDSFTISHTRAQSADTVHLALAGIFGNEKKELLNSCNNVLGEPTVAKPILCKGPSRYGMSALGKGIYPARMKVGEFEIVPGIGGALSFAFAVFNYGFPIQATSFSGSMEGNVRGALKGQVLTLNQIPDDDFISNLNGPPWLGCDGPTAAGGVRLFKIGRAHV